MPLSNSALGLAANVFLIEIVTLNLFQGPSRSCTRCVKEKPAERNCMA